MVLLLLMVVGIILHYLQALILLLVLDILLLNFLYITQLHYRHNIILMLETNPKQVLGHWHLTIVVVIVGNFNGIKEMLGF